MIEQEILRRQQELERRLDSLPEPEVGRWISFTPTVDQNGAVAATATFARYVVLSDAVLVQVRLVITAAGVAGNAISIGGFPAAILPTNAAASEHVLGTILIRDAGTAFYQGALVYHAANTFRGINHGAVNYMGITPNFALANGDDIGFQGAWER